MKKKNKNYINKKQKLINKLSGLFILLISYVIAYLVGFIIYNFLLNRIHIIFVLLLADIGATLAIFLIGLVYRTPSIYDPYWSLQTIMIGISLMISYNSFNLGTILFMIIVLIYSLRLTINFITTFDDITYIDWRYRYLKEKFPSIFFLVNLFAIHLMPTLLVFAGSLPFFLYIINSLDFSFLDLIGYMVMFIGIGLETWADISIYNYKKNRKNNNEIINIALWKYSRHPNYLGEITFWVGIALVYLLRVPAEWYYCLGCVAIYALFIFGSIPLQENHLITYKKNYKEYKKTHRLLLPIPKKVKEEA